MNFICAVFGHHYEIVGFAGLYTDENGETSIYYVPDDSGTDLACTRCKIFR